MLSFFLRIKSHLQIFDQFSNSSAVVPAELIKNAPNFKRKFSSQSQYLSDTPELTEK